jgi:hypothetical protein
MVNTDDNKRSPEEPVSTSTWSMVWQVVVLGTQTVTLVNASFMVVKLCGCGPASTVSGCEFTGLIPIGIVPDALVFWVEVAVITTRVGTETTGAVKSPEELTVPKLAFQVTVVAKVPVPVTTVKHWITWPDWMGAGEQPACTPVTVDPLLLEPQAAIPIITQAATSSRPIFFTPFSP